MLKHNTFHPPPTQALIPLQYPTCLSLQPSSIPRPHKNSLPTNTKPKKKAVRILRPINAALNSPSTGKATTVKAVITFLKTVVGSVTHLPIDDVTDFVGIGLKLELVAAELDDNSGAEKTKQKSSAIHIGTDEKKAEIYYESSFQVPVDFGEIGAVLVENNHTQEMFAKDIVFNGFSTAPFHITCNSWIPALGGKRTFFSDKSYLPSETPSGVKSLREKELENARGDGKGLRLPSDRIYDYDVYNDLGFPDLSNDMARPVLGGAKHPYPRRCRTGRPKALKDPLSESRSPFVYVPRNEVFSEVKGVTFGANTVYNVLHSVVPLLESVLTGSESEFPNFTTIDTLFKQGLQLHPDSNNDSLKDIIPRLVRSVSDAGNSVIRFEIPELLDRDKFSWIRDDEFGRQTLAGVNPLGIKLVTEWPLKSELDPAVYGPPESAITKEIVEKNIKGYTTFEEALEQKKLFILDYHDLLLPYVNKVSELKGTTLYGSRALFFLTPKGTLRPLAIELTRPPSEGKPQWKEVFEPCWNPTGIWLWRLAKAHVLAHDSGIHQLVSHWLRTHCSVEPYVIATNRQLSEMHPIHRLLQPHLRYTMEINALARLLLINAGGIIEQSFAPSKYAIELSSFAYDKLWRFDREALPADLIARGMAVEDPSAPHGLKLTIEDYPYANDGLLIWDAIKQWLTDYVAHHYPQKELVQSDQELQSWWTEIRTVGHGDKKDEPWWPELKTPDDLIGILATIIWVASGHHAAVNFGQYDFTGYFPNRPSIARKPMPVEDPSGKRIKEFIEKPETFLLECFPSQFQAMTVMAVVDVLSSHAIDEEYIGGKIQPYWEDDKVIKAAFERFKGRMVEIEGIIDGRNADTKLLNRTGAGVVPYELLKPSSEPGVTGKGVPNSISI